MNIGHSRRWLTLLVGAHLALTACSDEENKNEPAERPTLLNKGADLIAADALSENPSAEFLAVRGRVNAGVSKERRQYTRQFAIAGGRGVALVGDPTIRAARNETAITLGVMLDEVRANDVTLANATLDALLAELNKRFPGAQSCEQAGPKADDCAVALLVLEVKRSEAVANMMMDAGAPMIDSGAPSSDSSVLPDATTNVPDSSVGGPATAIDCGPRDITGAREVTGTIMMSEVWSGKVLVKSDVYVRGGTLTIMPGTQVFMDTDSSLNIGWANSEATLIANGTPDAPIRICGKLEEKGYWNTIAVESNVTSDSVMRNVLIADGAGEMVAALQLEADLTIDNVQVRNAQHSGVLAADFKENSRLLSVDGTAGPAVVLTSGNALTRFPVGGFFQNNTENVARVRLQYIDGTVVVRNIGIPYIQESTVYTRMSDLTFEAGVEYRFQPDTALEVGWSGATAAIHVNGTQASPVRFGGLSDVSSNWYGITLNSNVMSSSNVSYAEISHAGGGTAEYALDLVAPVKLDHVTLRGNARGMKVGAKGVGPGSSAVTITGTQSYPLTVEPDGLLSLPTASTYTGNMIDQVRVDGSYIRASGTIQDLGIPYLLASNLYVQGELNVTIAPGTDFLVGADLDIYFGWSGSNVTLTANGTADAPIRFIGLNESAGSWGGVVLESSVRTNSLLNYVQIGHGGQGGTALLTLRSNVPVTNSRFFSSAGYGITRAMTNPIDYMTSNTFEGIAMGNISMP